MNLREFFTPRVIAANYEETAQNRIPYFGEGLFPAVKKMGLDLSWIKGYGGLPVSLAPSAFDAKATFREIGEIAKFETEMPFFREAFHISEKDRQELLRARDANDPYAEAILNRTFDFTRNFIMGAHVVPERMRMSLLFPESGNMTISIKANGVAYEYDYDPNDEWKTNNYSALTSTALWSAPTTADPIKDFEDMKNKAADVAGAEIRYALMSSTTFNLLKATSAVKNSIISTSGVTQTYVTGNRAADVIESETGIRPIVYTKKYKNESGTTKSFVPDGYVTFIPEGALGKTWYGTTPEEADLVSGANVEVSVVDTGIAITRSTGVDPVVTNIYASEIVLPSYERMNEVVTLKVTA